MKFDIPHVNGNRNGNGSRQNPQIKPRQAENGLVRRNRKPVRRRRKFALIVGAISGVYLIIAVVFTANLLARSNGQFDVNYQPDEIQMPIGNNRPIEPMPSLQPLEEDDTGGLLRPPARTNVLIMGIDNQNLADVIIAASFVRDTGEINMLSIPRDTFTQPSDEIMERIRSTGSRPGNTFKINALWPLGRQYGAEITRDHLSQTLGINFHYYVKLDLIAFREIVDLIGGVEIEVPRAMVWSDPFDNPPLHINIQPGIHLMDGQMAEHFVRFRSYPDGDIGRISAQQQFMTQLFRQMLTREALLSNPVELIRIAVNRVDTDFRAVDATRYVQYIPNLRFDGMTNYTLPGYERRVHGQSMWIPRPEETLEIVSRLFHGITHDEDETITVFAPDESGIEAGTETSEGLSLSRSARISVINGSNIGGLARTVGDNLELKGYNVVNVDILRGGGDRPYSTQINVRQEDYDLGLGEDMRGYFHNAVRRARDIPDDVDIQIIIGRSEHAMR